MKHRTLIFAMVLLVVLSGCAQTNAPQSDAIKHDLEVYAAKQEQAYTHPEQWQDDFRSNDGMFTVEMDAKLNVPATMHYPVVEVEWVELTEDMAKDIAMRVVGDAKLYQAKQEQDATQGEIAEAIERIKAGEGSDLHEVYPLGYQLETAEYLRYLEQRMHNAPKTYTPKEGEFVFTYPPLTFSLQMKVDKNLEVSEQAAEEILRPYKDSEQIHLTAELGRAEKAELLFYKNVRNKMQGFHYSFGENPGGVLFLPEMLPKENAPTRSMADARTDADAFLAQLGLDKSYANDFEGMMFFDGAPLEYEGELTVELFEKLTKKCYVFCYTRDFGNGIQSAYIQGIDEGWGAETVMIGVDDTGVVYCGTDAFGQLGQVVNDNVALLPFEQIQAAFEAHIKDGYVWDNDWVKIESQKICIDEVRLSMMKVRHWRNTDDYLYVPVWDFIGHDYITYDENDVDVENRKLRESYVTINAVDGSVIDRRRGY
ncbi:DUF6034 family protein [Eubacteriales bacterium OttesenSCG-928-N14]|nr:DUF6034 family protein [Eubacteriales bacterium OttesenSCG-928-N14]